MRSTITFTTDPNGGIHIEGNHDEETDNAVAAAKSVHDLPGSVAMALHVQRACARLAALNTVDTSKWHGRAIARIVKFWSPGFQGVMAANLYCFSIIYFFDAMKFHGPLTIKVVTGIMAAIGLFGVAHAARREARRDIF